MQVQVQVGAGSASWHRQAPTHLPPPLHTYRVQVEGGGGWLGRVPDPPMTDSGPRPTLEAEWRVVVTYYDGHVEVLPVDDEAEAVETAALIVGVSDARASAEFQDGHAMAPHVGVNPGARIDKKPGAVHNRRPD